MCPSHVLIEVRKEIKIKFLNFFLLRLKLLYYLFENFVFPNLATHSHAANTQCAKTYTKAVE